MIFSPFKRRSIRKRSFLLFELVVSLALIALCLFPLIKTLGQLRAAELNHIQEIQLENASQLAFCEIKQRLYEQHYTWQQLNDGVEETPLANCVYKIHMLDEAKKPSFKKKAIVVDIEMIFTTNNGKNHVFHRTLYLEQQIEA